jgi:hypothetical protein
MIIPLIEYKEQFLNSYALFMGFRGDSKNPVIEGYE